MIISMHAFAAELGADVKPIRTELGQIDQTGNMELATEGTSFLDSGFELGDIVLVTVNNRKYRMPVVEHYSDVDKGAMLCRVAIDPDEGKDRIDIAVNLGNFAEYADIAIRLETDETPGYRWVLHKGLSEPINVMISMDEKGGYLEQLDFHHLKKSGNREDYPHLNDEAYANFREVTTTGMGDHVLYRSSTPFNPSIGRSQEADAACRKHKIKTIMNMTDSEQTMSSYEGFADSYAGTCNVICLNMVVDYESDSFRNSLAKGFTYLASQEGPYLVHCTEGKDRAGFASAVLEALMGAGDDEIIRDYMVTYENYYGVEPGSELYTKIADANIKKFLPDAFGLDTLEGEDLSAAAEKYLKNLGLTDETIENLKKNLLQK